MSIQPSRTAGKLSALLLFFVALLASCGGSSNKTTPPANTSFTVTCPNGSSRTATTQAIAEAACPAPALTFVSPANGDNTVSPTTFTDITVTTDSTLDAAQLTTANITLAQQGIPCCAPVAGSVSAVGSKGFKFTPSTTLTYGSTYNFAANVKDSLGKTLNINSTFTTAGLSCTPPLVSNGTSCVTPVSVTCPNGSTQSAASTIAANTACPSPSLVSLTPANGSTTVDPLVFTAIALETDSTLDALNLNASLSVGGVAVAGTTALSGSGKGITFTPNAQLAYGSNYQFSASVKDTLGKSFSHNATFSTVALVCVSPQIAYGGACVTPVTVTCPDGYSQTAATTAIANANCAPPILRTYFGSTLTGITGNTFYDPALQLGVTVGAWSQLDAANSSATLSFNGVSIPMTSAIGASYEVVFTPTQQLSYGTTYQFTASVKDTLGKALTVNSTLVTITVPATCTPPAMPNYMNVCMSPPSPTGYTWNNIIKAWVADIGTLVVGANTLPNACRDVGDACWNDSIANGTIKLVNSGVVMTGYNTRPILFAFFQIGNNGTLSAGNHNQKVIYGDTQALAPFNPFILDGSGGNVESEVKGTLSGIKINFPAFGCYEFVWKATFFGMNTSTCPL